MYPINRLEPFFPPRESVADKLLTNAWACKIELLRFSDDDGSDCSCEVEIRSTIEGKPDDVLAAILAEFRTPRGEAGVA